MMARWEVVFFYNDNSIEAVPDIWVKKDQSAWSKSFKNVKSLIKNRCKPNTTDFNYYPVRKLGTKNFDNNNPIYLLVLFLILLIVYYDNYF